MNRVSKAQKRTVINAFMSQRASRQGVSDETVHTGTAWSELPSQQSRFIDERVSNFDIAVVGKGPAACAAAIHLAKSGLQICLIAPPEEELQPVGEFLSPGSQKLLTELGIFDAFLAGPHLQAQVTYSSWGSDHFSQRHAILHPAGPGYILDRAIFNHMLLVKAIAGITRYFPTRLTQSKRESECWQLEVADRNKLTAKYVIYATGRSANVSVIPSKRIQWDKQIAATIWLKQRDPSIEPTQATLIEATSDGWWYASLLPNRDLTVTYFTDTQAIPRSAYRKLDCWRQLFSQTQFIQRWIDTAGFVVDQLPVIRIAGTSWLSTVGGDGWAAAGDAALAFDPLASHGIASALWGGKKVADVAVAYIAGDKSLSKEYQATLKSVLTNYQRQRQVLYQAEQRWANKSYWKRLIIPEL